jgi:CHAT domain-containing protein
VEKLVEEDQLDQAIQVLNLYQDQQFFDLDRDPETSIAGLALSPREERYKAELEKAGQRGVQVEEFKRQIGNRQPTQEEAATLARLQSELKAASDKYLAVLGSAAKEFATPRNSEDAVPPVTEVKQLQNTLLSLSKETGQNTVALYTMIDTYNFYLLVVSPETIKSFTTPIRSKVLEQKILQFYGLLQSTAYDPRVVGQELYDIILKPAKTELQRQKAQTLLWSLDGTLRYVPMAALWDGKNYLNEHYQNVQFTRADPKRMTAQVSSTWKGVGFGNSQETYARGSLAVPAIRFSSLPGVTLELDYLFGLDSSAKAILQGNVFIDKKFTRTAVYDAMKDRPAVVHFSSHFRFSPGKDWDSYLVLGDGTLLSMFELKGSERLFDGVELLTLSACNTAAIQADARWQRD